MIQPISAQVRNRETKVALRKEQSRLIIQDMRLSIRDVTESRLIDRILTWFFDQPERFRDEVLGDMKRSPVTEDEE